MNLPTLPSNIGKTGKVVAPDGAIYIFTIKGEICRAQSDNPEKILCLQLIEWQGGEKELRLGYYIIGKKPKMRGKWVWGQRMEKGQVLNLDIGRTENKHKQTRNVKNKNLAPYPCISQKVR